MTAPPSTIVRQDPIVADMGGAGQALLSAGGAVGRVRQRYQNLPFPIATYWQPKLSAEAGSPST